MKNMTRQASPKAAIARRFDGLRNDASDAASDKLASTRHSAVTGLMCAIGAPSTDPAIGIPKCSASLYMPREDRISSKKATSAEAVAITMPVR